jgi:hypothetical protein
MRHSLALTALLAIACGSTKSVPDAGPDGGVDAGPILTDGGAIGSACSSLDQCGGNCVGQGCPLAVICVSDKCASAGGADTAEIVKIGFNVMVPDYLQIYLFAPQLVAGGTLDCGTLLHGIDGGTLNLFDATKLNPLFDTVAQNTMGITGTEILTFELDPAASGSGRVLYMEGYLNNGSEDGGAVLLGRVCSTFDDTGGDAGTVSMTMTGLW